MIDEALSGNAEARAGVKGSVITAYSNMRTDDIIDACVDSFLVYGNLHWWRRCLDNAIMWAIEAGACAPSVGHGVSAC